MYNDKVVIEYDNSQHEQKLKKVACDIPFNSFHIYPEGKVGNCCFYWMPLIIGNITKKHLRDIIEDTRSVNAKKSVQDGTYKYCDSKICPSLVDYVSTGRITSPLLPIEKLPGLDQKKIILFLDYDMSCNLYCPSCRNERILHSIDSAPEIVKEVHSCLISQVRDLLQDGYEITLQVTSVGDPFASPFYWNFLKNIQPSENFKIRITTNGTLLSRDKLMLPYAQKIDHIEVSVDAFTEPTYNKVRRGGNFKALRSNLLDLDEMIADAKLVNLNAWGLNFVVQSDNYREMVDFARWALSFKKMTKLWFLLIYDWGHLPPDVFSQKAIWKEQHPEHQEFLEILKNPVFDNSNIQIGNLSSLRKKALSL